MQKVSDGAITRQVKVKNDLGLHTRPATMIAKLLQNSLSHVTFTYKKETIKPKSILSTLTLAARKNATITITATGSDAALIIEQLVVAFDTHFGE